MRRFRVFTAGSRIIWLPGSQYSPGSRILRLPGTVGREHGKLPSLVRPSTAVLGRVRLGSSGLGGLLRFRMRRSMGLIQIRMNLPSSSGSSEKFTDEFGSGSRKVWYFTTPWFGWAWHPHGPRENAPAGTGSCIHKSQVKRIWRLPHPDPNQTVVQRSSSHLIKSKEIAKFKFAVMTATWLGLWTVTRMRNCKLSTLTSLLTFKLLQLAERMH